MAPTKSPYIDPQQLYGYNRKAAAAYAGLSPAKGKAHVRQQITDHYKRTQLDPWVDQALMSGMGNLISGMTPNPPAVPPRTFGGFPVPGTGSPAGPIPWLDPANYPGGVPPWGGGGGGGGMLPGIPPLSDILGDIGGALLPNFGAPQGGVPPQGGMPPQGAMPMGPARSVGGQPTIGGPQFP